MADEMLGTLVLNELEQGHEIPVIVRGNSMEPTYHDGDLLRVAKTTNYYVGDIIVFNFLGKQIVHRIIKINNWRLLCKGDHAQAIQEITIHDVIGKVIRKET
ncbi:MAG: signal peptidase I [Clostridia bacterium]|nr:signal peptidase I [Clostridia bacterium]